MDEEAYRKMDSVQEAHWWFRARRRIISHILKKSKIPEGGYILEAGCGSGGNLAMLAQYGVVSAFESDEESQSLAREKGNSLSIQVLGGSLPDHVPFEDEHFDAICLLDVLEHVADDGQALSVLWKKLKPGGVAIITVPAFMFLWSEHDTLHHHYRRYRTTQLGKLARDAGFVSINTSYFNSLLFPLVVASRLSIRLGLRRSGDDLNLPSPLVGWLLETVFSLERFLLGWLPLPAGSSAILTARRPE